MMIFFAFLIGFFAGLRSLTPPAVIAWAAYLGWLKLERPLSLVGSLPAVVVLTVLALVELIADKLPKTPDRISLFGLLPRIVTGGLSGLCITASGAQGILPGVVFGSLGGVLGCFAGYLARTRIVKFLGTPDFIIALLEDSVAIAGCLWIVLRFS